MNDLYQSESTSEIFKSLISAHKEISHALKDSKNPHFRNDFASLTSVIDATKEAYLKHDCFLMQIPSIGDGGFPILITQISHTSGQWIRSFTPILSKDGSDPQKFGSGLTYARRYALAAISNLGQVDDDGNHASGKKDALEENSNDPMTWIYPFDYPEGMKGMSIEQLGIDGIMAAGKSLSSWKIKAGDRFPKDGDRFMDAFREILKSRNRTE